MDESKKIVYDRDLGIEAYRFDGVVQVFPAHFHEYYVIGLIEGGRRRLTVNNVDYAIGPGDIMTFNPGDSHSCEETDGQSLVYLGLNLKPEIWDAQGPAPGPRPLFSQPVQYRAELAQPFRDFHQLIMNRASALEKEEMFLVLMHDFLEKYAALTPPAAPCGRREIDEICAFLDRRYPERITLDQLSRLAGMNKFSLVRLFTRHRGITPYRYLETVRIGAAKKLLEQGVELARAAQETGFFDQSHFTNYFSRFMGLTPGHYQAIFQRGDK